MMKTEQQADELIKLAKTQARYHRDMKITSKQIGRNFETIAHMNEQFKHLQQSIIELEDENKELMAGWDEMRNKVLRTHTLLVDLSSVMMDCPTKKERIGNERYQVALAYRAGMNREWMRLEPAMEQVLAK